jgi:hypothetical protein
MLVFPYNVAFDAERNLWYADIQFTNLQSYYPFIRLALVRYQPNSTRGRLSKLLFDKSIDASISPVVLADFAQITPDRTLSVVGAVGSKTLHVTLSGIFPQSGTQTAPNMVQVFLQRRQSGVPDPDLGWTNLLLVGIRLTPDKSNAPQTYQGDIPLPTPRGSPGADYRLLVTEYEYYSNDPNPVVPPPPELDALNPIPDIPRFRLVYAETVPI